MGTRLTIALSVVAAFPLAAQSAPADTAETYPVMGYVGRMTGEGEHVDLLGIEIIQMRPERIGTRFQLGTWRQSVASGNLMAEVEVGPAGAFRLMRGLRFVPSGGGLFAFGNGIAWGFYGTAALVMEPKGHLVARIGIGRHWYRIEGEFFGLNTWTAGVGWRLGPYPAAVAVPD